MKCYLLCMFAVTWEMWSQRHKGLLLCRMAVTGKGYSGMRTPLTVTLWTTSWFFPEQFRLVSSTVTKPSPHGSDACGTPISALAGSFMNFILVWVGFVRQNLTIQPRPTSNSRSSCLRLLSAGTESLNLAWILKLDFQSVLYYLSYQVSKCSKLTHSP